MDPNKPPRTFAEREKIDGRVTGFRLKEEIFTAGGDWG